MNSLEFIDKLIVEYEKSINNFIRFSKGHPDKELFIKCVTIYEEKLNHLRQIKTELEIMELIKNGWSSAETTLNGDQIMRFQNLKLDDWVKLWNKLEEILLKKALEVKDD